MGSEAHSLLHKGEKLDSIVEVETIDETDEIGAWIDLVVEVGDRDKVRGVDMETHA